MAGNIIGKCHQHRAVNIATLFSESSLHQDGHFFRFNRKLDRDRGSISGDNFLMLIRENHELHIMTELRIHTEYPSHRFVAGLLDILVVVCINQTMN
jgi:hypothetical protein